MKAEQERRVRSRRRKDGIIGLPLPRPGPKATFAFLWWVLGLYALFFAQGFTPSPESEQSYSQLMQQAVFSEEAKNIEKKLENATRELNHVHVWGWRWREPYSTLVPQRKEELARAQEEFNLVRSPLPSVQLGGFEW